MLKIRTLLHDIFIAGITINFIYGTIESLIGLVIFFIKSDFLANLVQNIFQNELINDPHDFIANHLIHLTQTVSVSTLTFVSIYLMIHGALKIGLSLGLWYKKEWAYPAAAIILSLFVIYQSLRFFRTHSPILLFVTLVDILIISLIRTEHKRIKHYSKSN